MAFGSTLKWLREALDLTQDELSERSGVKQATISVLERRDSRSSRYAVDLATALGVTVEQMQHLPRDQLYATATRKSLPRPALIAYEPAATYYKGSAPATDQLVRLFDELTAPQRTIIFEQIRSFVDANRLVLQTFATRDGNDTADGDHA
jgi:transcriptional regulator with XRE-family HTH domain